MSNLILISLIIVYIIDISGFVDEIENFFFKKFKIGASRLKPFNCSKCMTWWIGLLTIFIQDMFTLKYIALVAAISMLSNTISQLLIFIREALNKTVNKLIELIS